MRTVSFAAALVVLCGGLAQAQPRARILRVIEQHLTMAETRLQNPQARTEAREARQAFAALRRESQRVQVRRVQQGTFVRPGGLETPAIAITVEFFGRGQSMGSAVIQPGQGFGVTLQPLATDAHQSFSVSTNGYKTSVSSVDRNASRWLTTWTEETRPSLAGPTMTSGRMERMEGNPGGPWGYGGGRPQPYLVIGGQVVPLQ
ncbi:MAG: hypothetical protein IT371_22680 [Deltaproteobacteria bacterium]|nr:hypothetical protein [Deltaproteobacteria bacterium]